MTEPTAIEGGATDDADRILPPDTSLLDLVDNVLHKGVVVQGELILGLAGIDLVFVGVNAILCSADRVVPPETKR